MNLWRIRSFSSVIEWIRTDPEKCKTIEGFPVPRNRRELQAFLGFINFHNRFTSKYAERIVPLLDLLKKNKEWNWDEIKNTVCKDIKLLFSEKMRLMFPEPGKPFYVVCDSSDNAIGGSLFRLGPNAEIRPISCTGSFVTG